MRKQLISFAQVEKFLENIKFKGRVSNPKTPPCVRSCLLLTCIKFVEGTSVSLLTYGKKNSISKLCYNHSQLLTSLLFRSLVMVLTPANYTSRHWRKIKNGLCTSTKLSRELWLQLYITAWWPSRDKVLQQLNQISRFDKLSFDKLSIR